MNQMASPGGEWRAPSECHQTQLGEMKKVRAKTLRQIPARRGSTVRCAGDRNS